MLKTLIRLAPVVIKLGLINVANVILYRLRLKSGVIKRRTPIKDVEFAPDFETREYNSDSFSQELSTVALSIADQLCSGKHPYYWGKWRDVGTPPSWFREASHEQGRHWSETSINTSVGFDVKDQWDLSRFHWAPYLACAHVASGNPRYLQYLNTYLEDWCEKNKVNSGFNCVCVQEFGIRLINLLNSAYILKQHDNRDIYLTSFVLEHCHRIYPTLQYSIAQQNNHGISEAVALYIGGSWLASNSTDADIVAVGKRYAKQGRSTVERLVSKLISLDGGFSMYSLNYHRVVLDTLATFEFWRRVFQQERFTDLFYKRCGLLTEFLASFVDPQTGDVPNIGTNDGSRSFLVVGASYRDYRPSVQMGRALFQGELEYCGKHAECLEWMKEHLGDLSVTERERNSNIFTQSGFVVIVPEGEVDSWGCARFPSYSFRPSHSDQLHFDLWYQGRNILRDSGTFSYNTERPIEDYFTGTVGHNTVQFDDTEPMPRLSKFLVSDWLSVSSCSSLDDLSDSDCWQAGYHDKNGRRHYRKVTFCGNGVWRIEDQLSGTFSKAVLRWHLEPGQWKLLADGVEGQEVRLQIKADANIVRLDLSDGWESRFYGERTENPMLEVEVYGDTTKIVTEVFLG